MNTLAVFYLAPLHVCKSDKDCDSRAKCEKGKCICQGNTTGNGKYCRGNYRHHAWLGVIKLKLTVDGQHKSTNSMPHGRPKMI